MRHASIIALPTEPGPGRARGSRARGRARPAAPARSAARAGADAESQARLVDPSVAVEEQVEVDRARAEARSVALTRPSERSIASRRSSSSRGGERRLELGGAVEEARLVLVTDRVGLAQRRDRDHSTPSSAASSSTARSICARGSSRFAPSPTKLLVMAAIVRHPARVAATVSRAVRRSVLTGVVALCCSARPLRRPCSPTRASRSPPVRAPSQRLQAYPRTLVELDHVRGPAEAPALRRAGGELIDPSLSIWRLPSWTAQRLLPGLQAPRARPHGHARTCRSAPIRAGASGFLGQFTDPLSPTEWWPPHVGVTDWVAPGPGRAGDDDRLRRRPLARGVRRPAEHDRAEHADLPPPTTRSCTAPRPPRSSARPSTRKGIVGIYPQAKLQLWDASPAGQLTVGDEIAGLAAAARRGPRRDQPQPRRLRPAADRGARDPERLRRRPADRRLGRERPRGRAARRRTRRASRTCSRSAPPTSPTA